MREIVTHLRVVLALLLPVTVSAQQIQWQPCVASQFNHWFGEEKPSPDLLCGYLSAPLKYMDTGGDASYEEKSQVKLALTKLPTKSKHRGGVLIISDGPGLPGINPYINFGWSITNLRESWDIIEFDPRGVRRSTPTINCQQSDTETQENITEKQQVLDKINACIHNIEAEVIHHIGSNETIYDIDRIRQTLGDKQLAVVTYSYGTQIAALYAERFPYSVRSIVLGGVVDIDNLEDNFTWQLKQAQSHQETFDRLVSWCARTKSCPLSSDRGKAITQFHELLSKLYHKPLSDSKRGNVPSDGLISLTTDLLLWRSSWPTLVTAIRQSSRGIVSNKVETALSAPTTSEESSDASGVILCVDQGGEQLTPEE